MKPLEKHDTTRSAATGWIASRKVKNRLKILSLPVTAFRKISINDRDQVSQILIGSDLRIHESIDLRIHIFETFKCGLCETSHDLFRLYLNFTQLLNIRSKLRLLLNDECYASVNFFVTHR